MRSKGSFPSAHRFAVLTLFAFATISAFASSAPVSENIRVDFDPQKTAIKFSLADFMHDVHGQFHLKSGSLRFDRQSGAASGSLIVDAGSGDSGSGSRDSKMKHDILDAARFPEIVFLPKSVIGTVPERGTARVQVLGVFRIHGIDHEISLPVTITVAGSTFELTTTFVVPYVSWGMKDPSALFLRVGKEVGITVTAAGRVNAPS
jgi:polyisoprenoid-binding protein YceI